MFIEKIEQNIVKINFYVNEDEVYIGDLIKVVASGKKGVIAQVIKLESPENNKGYNTASSKIIFTVSEEGKLTEWQGNVPGNDFMASKATPQEVLSITRTGKVENKAFSGKLSCYPDFTVNLEASFLERQTAVIADKDSQKKELLKDFACNLSEKKAKVLLVDNNCEFSDIPGATILKAGKDVKLPFDLNGIETLYNKLLSDVSNETRAGIENIFSEIEDYLTSKKVSFLPFKVFVDAVRSENQQGKLPELELLNNSLSRIYKKGIFADNQKEIITLFNELNRNNLVILDLSEIEKSWKHLFVNFVIRLNTEKLKRKFFLLMDIDKYKEVPKTDLSDIIDQLYNQGFKNGIKPIIFLGHGSKFIYSVLNSAENLFALKPQNRTKLSGLSPYITRLNDSEILVKGKVTNNVPLFIKLPAIEEPVESFFNTDIDVSEPEIEITLQSENLKTVKTKQPIPEIYGDPQPANEPEEKTPQYESQFKDPVAQEEQDPAQVPVSKPEQPEFKGLLSEELHQQPENEIQNIEEEFQSEFTDYTEHIDHETEPKAENELIHEEMPQYETHETFSKEYTEIDEQDLHQESADNETISVEEHLERDEIEDEMEEEDCSDIELDLDPEEEFQQGFGSGAEVAEQKEKTPYELALDELDNEVDTNVTQQYSDNELYEPNPDDQIHSELNEEDEEEYYDSEEFQDENSLDYINAEENQNHNEEYTTHNYNNPSDGEFSDEDIRNFMDDDASATNSYAIEEEDEEEYYDSEEFQDESALDYVETDPQMEREYEYLASVSDEKEEFSDEDLMNFMDDDEEEPEPLPKKRTSQPKEILPKKKEAPQEPEPPQTRKPEPPPEPPKSDIPVYEPPKNEKEQSSDKEEDELQEGDTVRHKKYGVGVIQKVIGYSEKKLCSIQFEDVGRRLLDPNIAELEKI